jgi:glycine cleavage system aminomethyltransferase T
MRIRSRRHPPHRSGLHSLCLRTGDAGVSTELSLSRLVALHHGDFIGRDALRQQWTIAPSPRRFEINADAHRSPYHVPGRSAST